MIVIILILTSLVAVLIYLVFLLNKKINFYENFILERHDAYLILLKRIREIDNKEIFEKDDEVGITFLEIKNEIEEFDKIIQ